jgi:thiamine biosynthesis lipoprotein
VSVFLYALGLYALGAGLAAERVLVEREAYLMGTRARLAVWDDTRAAGLERVDRALAALEETEAQLSTWRSDSAVSALNQTQVGHPWQAGASLCVLFQELTAWVQRTDGAFDPAIGRTLAAWDVHGTGRVPSPEELAGARARSGFSRLAFDADRCTVTRAADAALDTGAFGKGEALDRAARVLGDAAWMIDLGGQVAVGGGPGGGNGWPVDVAHPRTRDRRVLTVIVRGGSLSTSGGSERDLIVQGIRVGHVLDPRTGRPAPFDGSVTVWHPRALVADILSTALFVMGPDEGLRWARALGLSVCYLIPEASGGVRTLMTPAFESTVLSSAYR